jgi:hypothetical protein
MKCAILNNLGRDKESLACFEQLVTISPDETRFKANIVEALLKSKKYDESERLAKQVRNETDGKNYEEVMRLFIIRSLFFRNLENEAKNASQDLINYYRSSSIDYKIDWDFHGLKDMIHHSTLNENQKELLLSIIYLFETEK